MKLRFLLLLALAVTTLALAPAHAGSEWNTRTETTTRTVTRTSPCTLVDAPWFPRYEKAAEAAATARKKKDPRRFILIVFTGCPWDETSVKFIRSFLNQPDFTQYATLNFLLYHANFPTVPLPPAISKMNAELAGHYRVDHYPMAVIVDHTGKLMASVDCDTPYFDVFMSNLEDARKAAYKADREHIKSPWQYKKEF